YGPASRVSVVVMLLSVNVWLIGALVLLTSMLNVPDRNVLTVTVACSLPARPAVGTRKVPEPLVTVTNGLAGSPRLRLTVLTVGTSRLTPAVVFSWNPKLPLSVWLMMLRVTFSPVTVTLSVLAGAVTGNMTPLGSVTISLIGWAPVLLMATAN